MILICFNMKCFSIFRKFLKKQSKHRLNKHISQWSLGYKKPMITAAPAVIRSLGAAPALKPTLYSAPARIRTSAIASAMASGGSASFSLSPSTVLKFHKGDITQWFVDGKSDAIVSSLFVSIPDIYIYIFVCNCGIHDLFIMMLLKIIYRRKCRISSFHFKLS